MPNYIYDDTLLFFPKTDLTPIPSGGDPTQFVQALDWNTLNQAVDDIKGVLRGAEWTGFAPQGADPAPAGVDDYLWFDNADNLFMHVGGGGGSDINLTASGGIVASASNVNVGGVGVFKQLVGSNLEFKGINAGSSKISVVDEVGNNEIDIDVVEANVVHQNLSGAGTKTHAQIDTHVGVFEGVSQGSVWYSTGTVPAALGPGTSGQFLQTSGVGGNPIWANAALIIQDEGSGVTNTPHSTLNFVGPGVVVTDGGGGIALVTVGGGAGNSLNAAYLVNRTITATSDAVQILGTSDNTDHTLEVTKVPGSARDGHAIAVTMGSQATDYGINIGYTQISVAADGRGLRLINTTIAAAGNQQNSPVVAWVGQGWKTDATAETQEVLFAQQVVPIEGAAAPTGELRWYSAINGGAFTEIMTVNSAGTSFTAAGMTISNDGTITTLLGTAGDYLRIGDAASTASGFLSNNDDLLVTGKFEVAGASSFVAAADFKDGLRWKDSAGLNYVRVFNVADDGIHFGINATDNKTNHNFILVSIDNVADDYDHQPASADPTFIIHSETAAASATDQFIAMSHNRTSGIISSGVGGTSIEGLNISNDGIRTTILGTAGDYLRIGDATSTTASLNSPNDLLITGRLELASTAFFKGSTLWVDSAGNEYGRIINAADSGLHLGIVATDGRANHNFILVSRPNVFDDYDHSTPSADPTFIVHSATAAASATNQFLRLTHNQTSGIITAGTGGVSIEGLNISNDTAKTTLLGIAGDYIRIGDAGSTTGGVGLNSNNDLLVSGKLEVSSTAYLKTTSWTNSGGINYMFAQSSVDSGLHFGIDTTDGLANHNLILVSAHRLTEDYDHQPTSADPTFIIHSETAAGTATNQFLRLTHDKTSGIITAGIGGVSIEGLNISNDGTITTLLGTAGDYLRIGDAVTATSGLNSNDDLLVTRNFEVEGTSTLNLAALRQGFTLEHNGSLYGRMRGSTDGGLTLSLDNTDGLANHNFILISIPNVFDDYDHQPLSVDPTFIIHSATSSAGSTVEFLRLTHDKTSGIITAGTGGVSIEGLNISNDGTKTTILGTAGDYLRFGDGGTATQAFNSPNDCLVSGRLEVKDAIFSTTTVHIDGGGLEYARTLTSGDDGFKLALVSTDGITNHNFLVISRDNRNDYYDHQPASVDPTVFIHSATAAASATNQFLRLTHDQTSGIITAGIGGVSIEGLNISNDGTITTLLGTAGDYLRIGDATTSVSGLASNDDLLVTGKFEAAGAVTLLNGAVIRNFTTFNNVAGDQFGALKAIDDSGLHFGIGAANNRANHNLILVTQDSISDDYDHSTPSTHPTWIVHSAASAASGGTRRFGATWHDNDNFRTTSGRGGHSFELLAQHAEGTITLTGQPSNNESFVVNATTITAKTSGAGANEFNIGASVVDTITNMVATINADAESGNARAWAGAGTSVVVEWLTAGTAGNSITFTTALSNSSIDGGGTLGGTHAGIAAYTALAIDSVFHTFKDATSTLLTLGNTFALFDLKVLPSVDNTQSVGRAANRWADLHTTLATIAGLSFSNDGTITTLLGTAGDYVRIGDAGTTSHSLNSEDDLMVTGELEVQGQAWFESSIFFPIDRGIGFQNGQATLTLRDAPTVDTMVFGLPSVSTHIVFTTQANFDFDNAHPFEDNPTIFIHSANQSTTEWLGLTHDGSSAQITAGTGGVSIEGLNISNDGTITTLLGTAGDYLRIGDASTTSHSYNSEDDLVITGRLEVDGITHFDDGAFFNNGATVANDRSLSVGGNSNDSGRIRMSTAQTPNSILFGTGTLSNAVIMMNRGDIGVDFEHPLQAHPTWFWQNNDVNSIYGFGGIWHDNDAFTFISGRGGYSFELDAQYAQGTLTLTGQPTNNQTFVINATTITAKTSGAGADEFNIGGDVATTITNIVAAINSGTESGNVKAWDGAGTTVVCEWKTAGTAGNAITFTNALSNATIDGGGTLGGTHAGIAAVTPITLSADALTVADTINFVFNTGTGTKLGTGITQKMAFWNATPVVQPGHIADPAGGGTIDAEARTAINAILADLAELGLQASA